MNAFLLPLAGLLLSTASQTIANDTQNNRAELHAAVTDMPVVVDMSHADPTTWHSAPLAVEVDSQSRDGPACIMFGIDAEACAPMIIARR
jgi:hypothetical protein